MTLLSERYIGLMSGTSCDGVDAVLADFANERVQTLGHVHVPFTTALRDQLQSLMQSGGDEIERIGDASVALAKVYAEATQALIAKTGCAAGEIAALGAHGQTIRHRPERGFTLQINQPALIAELTGIAVVADFRSRDVAAGGQGAPLVPAFHAAVFSSNAPRAVVNIGGIANVSLLPSLKDFNAAEPHPHPGFARRPVEGEGVQRAAPLEGEGAQRAASLEGEGVTNDESAIRGFDTGPGNTLLDGWCMRHTGKAYDENGAWGASGRVDAALLAHFLDEPYFRAPPPKSTGRELFNMNWLDQKLASFAANAARAGKPVATLAAHDVQATLAALTATTIAKEIEGRDVFVCGGGVFNAALMQQIPRAKSTAALGVDPMHVEALAFAWLARECFAARAGNVPTVTGARGQRVLGAVYAK